MGFFDSFSGSAQRKDIRNAQATADAALSQGYTDAQGYYTQARDSLDPYAQGGQKGYTTYQDTLGLNGDAARAAAQAIYTSDPIQQQLADTQLNRLFKQYNAGGMGNSGANRLAASRAWLENYGNWQNQLKGVGDQGLQVAGTQAGLTQGLGDLAYGYGATKAGNAINYGNALAGTRNIGIQNLLNVGGLAMKAFSPTGMSGQTAAGNMWSGINRLYS